MIGRDDCFNFYCRSGWLACKIHSDLAAKSTIVITVFATITLRSKHRQLWNCEIHFATEQYNYKYRSGTGAISTFAEFKDLSLSRILEVELACKCRLMISAWARLCRNTCIRMHQSTWNTIIDVKNHFEEVCLQQNPPNRAGHVGNYVQISFSCVLAAILPFRIFDNWTIWTFYTILHSRFNMAEIAW